MQYMYITILHAYTFILYVAPSRDTLYSGMMYYEKKEVGHWKTMYSVVRDLEVLKRVKYIIHMLLDYTIIALAFGKQAHIKY